MEQLSTSFPISSPHSSRALWRTVLLVAAPFALFCLVLLGVGEWQARAAEKSAFRDRAEHSLRLLSSVVAPLAARQDWAQVEQLLSASLAAPGATVRAVELHLGEQTVARAGPALRAAGGLTVERQLPGGVRLVSSFALPGWRATALRENGVLLLAAVLLSVVVAYFVGSASGRRHRRLVRALSRSAHSLQAMLDELSRATEQQAHAASEGVNALMQMQDETQSVQKLAERITQSAAQLASSGEAAEQGVDAVIGSVNDASASIQQLQVQMGTIDVSAALLRSRAAAVDEIASRVGILAERSHLLALNASMEAARAGGHGRGFAVVSQQMRSLANGSHGAAGEVKVIIAEIQEALARALNGAEESNRRIVGASALAERALQRMNGYGELTRELVGMGRQIAQSAEGQIAASSHMSETIVQASQASMEQLQATQHVDEANGKLRTVSASLLGILQGKAEVNEAAGDAPVRWLDPVLLRTLALALVPFALIVFGAVSFSGAGASTAGRELAQRRAAERAGQLAAVLSTGATPLSATELDALLTVALEEPGLTAVELHGQQGLLLRRGAPEPLSGEVVGGAQFSGAAQRVEVRANPGGSRGQGLWTAAVGVVVLMGLLCYGVALGHDTRLHRMVQALRRSVSDVDEATLKLASASSQHGTASSTALQVLDGAQSLARRLSDEVGSVADSTEVLATQRARAEEQADQAIAVIIDARMAMGHVREQMVTTGEAVRFFSERAGTVGEIAGVVAKLSQRSNLLALNAAIEASRAGEEGRGFAVVAQEMRGLAASSSQSAADVKAVVEEIQAAVQRAVDDVQQGEAGASAAEGRADATAASIAQFATILLEFTRVTGELAEAASQQREAMGRMMRALRTSFDEGTAQQRASEQVRMASQELLTVSRELGQALDQSRAGGHAPASPPPSPGLPAPA